MRPVSLLSQQYLHLVDHNQYLHFEVCTQIHKPTSAAWIMLTSFPPSPMQHTRFLVCFRISRATSAFCVGEHLQATTADSLVAISINSFLKRSRHNYDGQSLRKMLIGTRMEDKYLERIAINNQTAI